MGKVEHASRMESLDALRGFALFGIFIVHMPELFELYWAKPATDPLQLAVHDTVWLLFAGKAFALLALCFGVSFFIIMDRAARRGIDFTGRFVWRLALLALLGLAVALAVAVALYFGRDALVARVPGSEAMPMPRAMANALLGSLLDLAVMAASMLAFLIAYHGASGPALRMLARPGA